MNISEMSLDDLVKEIMILDNNKEIKRKEIALITTKANILRNEINKRYPDDSVVVEFLTKQKIKNVSRET